MSDLSHIPDEAWIDVVAAVGWDESNELWPVLQKALAAALPVLNTARATCDEPMPVEGNAEEAQTCDHPAMRGTTRCPIHDPRHQRYIDSLTDEVRHLRQLLDERDAFDRERASVLNTAKDSETEALRAELEQHRSGESYEIGENYGRTTQANSCVRDLLEAVYPGDPMPDRSLDTVWTHLLEKVRVDSADVDKWRMLRLEPLGMEIDSPDEAYVARIRERLNDWFNVRAERKLCVCGQPTTLDTVHRADGPCYVADPAASLRGEQ